MILISQQLMTLHCSMKKFRRDYDDAADCTIMGLASYRTLTGVQHNTDSTKLLELCDNDLDDDQSIPWWHNNYNNGQGSVTKP
jgi:hypothetical protein